jgi:hypothetical protein
MVLRQKAERRAARVGIPDGRRRFAQAGDASQAGAAGERRVADERETVGQYNSVQFDAAVKRVAVDIRKSVWEHGALQGGAAVKRALAYGRDIEDAVFRLAASAGDRRRGGNDTARDGNRRERHLGIAAGEPAVGLQVRVEHPEIQAAGFVFEPRIPERPNLRRREQKYRRENQKEKTPAPKRRSRISRRSSHQKRPFLTLN